MSEGVYKYQERKLNYYKEDPGTGLKLIDLMSSGNQEEVDKFIKEKEIPLAAVQLLNFMIENNIPFESVSKIDRTAGLERMGRYGNQFAISTKSLLENLPKRNSAGELDKSNQQVFGMELLDLENTFYEYSLTHPSFIGLSNEERDLFVQKKIQQFIENPEKFYPGIKKLLHPSIRSLSEKPPEGILEGTRLYLFLYSQMFRKIEKEGEYASYESFESPKNSPSYFFCKDSEFYFNSRFNTQDSGQINSPDRTVFSKNGRPILIQKTGGYKTEYGEKGDTNATALNLEPIFVAGILYPPGTIFGVVKSGDSDYVKNLGNQSYDISEIEGLVPLRLSIYSISKEGNQRQEAFGEHYRDFKSAITEPEGDIEGFKMVAQSVISQKSRPKIDTFPNPYAN
jgi:hypothetical protein